jgi:hypothetical protein
MAHTDDWANAFVRAAVLCEAYVADWFTPPIDVDLPPLITWFYEMTRVYQQNEYPRRKRAELDACDRRLA